VSLFILPVTSQTSQIQNQKDSVSYGLGIVMGASLRNAGIETLNDPLFLLGINDAMAGKQAIMTSEQANTVINQYVMELNQKQGQELLIKGKEFLEENSKKEGVITLASGLQYKVIKEGSGKSPVDTSKVTVHYTGSMINGDVFDSSVERGEPIQFPVNGVIPGWTEALKLMKAGDNWILYIPSDLAYGERGNQAIPPNSVLIFDVQLIAIE
jgi:FKBP-type peptidyl-prolyl cis-trans isomerase FklB